MGDRSVRFRRRCTDDIHPLWPPSPCLLSQTWNVPLKFIIRIIIKHSIFIKDLKTSMATATLTEAPPTSTAEDQPQVYGCIHIKSILEKYGERVRQEYDSAMSIVIQSSSSSKSAKVKVLFILWMRKGWLEVMSRLPWSHPQNVDVFQLWICWMCS